MRRDQEIGVYPDIRWKYDVFLSFRGEDTRKNFTDHLYVALNQKGIITFRDDKLLERGGDISSTLFRAIEESMFSIIIFSKNYASSTWCLNELVKIVECIEEKRHTAFPVFYDVDPDEVRKQTGAFKEAFDRHEYRNIDMVRTWRSALEQVANLAGWHLGDRHEAQLVKEIVMEISKRLDELFSGVANNFVGVKHRVKELVNDYLEVGSDDVRFIGIYGMGGIGKTTIARALYDMFSSQFDDRCFLANVREESKERNLVPLQRKLLSMVLKDKSSDIYNVYDGVHLISKWLCRKKVFLVLDDVDQFEQLEALAGKRNWFGYGSRIIITTRDKHLLISHGIYSIYEVRKLNHNDALSLFHSRAFKQKQPTDEYILLSNLFIEYTQALPLALEVLGSRLCDRSVDEWRSELDRLREIPNEKIMEVLKISFNGLNKLDQKIFLDIACFFKGKDKDRVMKKLESFGYKAAIGIRELMDKSLITIVDNKLWMHDLIQEMGWKIVRDQYRYDPGKWSRLWFSKDIYHVLEENIGSLEVEGIMLDKVGNEITKLISGESFSKMKNLRLLKITNNIINLSDDLEYLSKELRFLKWLRYPSNSLPSSFQPENLFKLNLCYSSIKYLWQGIKHCEKLHTIKLCHSCNLIMTPDFTKIPNLERLDLEGCINLAEVHQSVGFLKCLVVLNLKNCKSLVNFPSNVSGLKSLKILNLHGCSKLDKLPNNLGEVECLELLDLSRTAISEFPSSVVLLTNLKKLSVQGCKGRRSRAWSHNFLRSLLSENSILKLPPLIGFYSLRRLDISDCNFLDATMPSDLGSFPLLEELNLSRNNLVNLPEGIKQLLKLKILYLENCPMLRFLSELPPEIIFVGAENCSSLELETLSTALKSTSTHIELQLFNCSRPVENQGSMDNLEVNLLKSWLERLSSRSSQFHIRLPGSEIPKWFGDIWEEGSSISILLPIDQLDEFMGFAVCVVFSAPGYQEEAPIVFCGSLKIKGQYHTFGFSVPIFASIESDHLWLGYLSNKLFQKPWSRRGLMGTIARASFEVLPRRNQKPIAYLKRCGIRLVYYPRDEANFAAGYHTSELKWPMKLSNSSLHPPVTSMMSHRPLAIPSVLIRSSIRKFYDGAPVPDDKRALQNNRTILSAPT